MLNSSLTQLGAALRSKKISSVELAQLYLDRIAALNTVLNAYITTDAETSLIQARTADAMLASGRAQPLTGIPIAQKDIFCAKGWRTTCGSRMLEGLVSPYTATAVARLQAAGAAVVGKTNLDEFGMGSSTDNSALQKTSNPWDTERVAGGSSGGSAAARLGSWSEPVCMTALPPESTRTEKASWSAFWSASNFDVFTDEIEKSTMNSANSSVIMSANETSQRSLSSCSTSWSS